MRIPRVRRVEDTGTLVECLVVGNGRSVQFDRAVLAKSNGSTPPSRISGE